MEKQLFEIIREARKNSGYTQLEVAELANLSEKTISAYETGRRTPSIEILKILAKVLKVEPSIFMKHYEPRELRESEMTYDEFLENFDELEDYTESGLCEIFDTDQCYEYMHYIFAMNDWCGFFLISLKDGIAFAPVFAAYGKDGFEQIDRDFVRKLDLSDQEDLFEAGIEDALEAIERKRDVLLSIMKKVS